MFGKGLPEKSNSTERRSAPATQEGQQYKVLTLNDLPKLSPASTTGVPPPRPNMIPTITTTASHQMILSDGPRRSLPEDSYVDPASPDEVRSYAGSIVSPSTPNASRTDYTYETRGGALAPPVPVPTQTNPFQSREDDEQDSPNDDKSTQYDNKSFFNYYAEDGRSQYGQSQDGQSQYDNKSFFNYYTEEQTAGRPAIPPVPPMPSKPLDLKWGDQSVKSEKSKATTATTGGPPLRTNMLDLGAWSPSTSRMSSNPFGRSPTDQYPAGYGYGYGYATGNADVSPVSATEPASQEIRYSDCGVNPFEGLDEQALRERDSGEVGDIWNMITGRAKEVDTKKPAPSPAIQIDASALSPQSSSVLSPPVSEVQKIRSLQDFQIYSPNSVNRSPSVKSPSEWFRDILIHYEGRPAEISRAMSYIPQPESPYPPGLSPSEITTMALPYLIDIETELEELQRLRANPQAAKVQQERDRVRELIQRQLAHDQAIDALESATGGKRLTKEQLDPSKIWDEIDLTAARQSIYEDKNRAQSYMTTWPGFEDETSEAPPVPRIPSQLNQPKPFGGAGIVKMKSPLGSLNRKPEKQPEPNSPDDIKEIPIVLDTRSEMSSNIRAFNEDSPVYNQYLQSQPSPSGSAVSNSPTNTSTSGFKWSLAKSDYDEKFPSAVPKAHTRNESTNTVSAPPPYTQGVGIASSSQIPQRLSVYSEQSSVPQARMMPIRASDLPRIATGSSGGQQQAEPVNQSFMQFTPTTPYRARNDKRGGEGLGSRIGLGDIGFRSFGESDKRDRAEKKRQRQEKRERLFRRGGSLWLCGICCGVQKMTRKLKIFWWSVFIIFVVIATTVGTILAVKKSNERAPVTPSQPLNLVTLSGLPPMPIDPITVTPRLLNTVDTCITPSTIWSCELPPPLAGAVNPDQPIFNWKLTAVNTSTNFVNPNPLAVLADEYKNFSKIDGVNSSPPEGEPTDFFISLLQGNTSDAGSNGPVKAKREHIRHFPRQALPTSSTTVLATITTIQNPGATITPTTPPSVQTTLSPAVLPSFYNNQQLRFFDRDLPTEHYKFIVHFDKVIYLRTIDGNTSPDGTNKLDSVGGVPPSEARFMCMWPKVRYITKIFTRPDEVSQGKKKFIVDPNTLAVIKDDTNAGGFAGYAVQIEEDIASYVTENRGSITCYPIDDRGKIDTAGALYAKVTNGINTGTVGTDYRGCQCSWSNFKESS
ncbi:hypothetical protein H072_4743 [Dactylellina haptotyla CBS 200.50]|uniref:Glycoprotease family protein n=1 Tax=Dactylellina haptotyla (strain CBS 200.50) TaxID=1284197 RepID=S8AED4_DACHA|nr:hypothetical protein H072_4743 [Dactylellina haptotyla CBS 200.50]